MDDWSSAWWRTRRRAIIKVASSPSPMIALALTIALAGLAAGFIDDWAGAAMIAAAIIMTLKGSKR